MPRPLNYAATNLAARENRLTVPDRSLSWQDVSAAPCSGKGTLVVFIAPFERQASATAKTLELGYLATVAAESQFERLRAGLDVLDAETFAHRYPGLKLDCRRPPSEDGARIVAIPAKIRDGMAGDWGKGKFSQVRGIFWRSTRKIRSEESVRGHDVGPEGTLIVDMKSCHPPRKCFTWTTGSRILFPAVLKHRIQREVSA